MTALSRIIVPLDGSPLAEAALPLARTFARRLDAALELVHVHGVRYGGGDDAAEEHAVRSAREYLEGVARRIGEETGTPPDVTLLEGVVSREIADHCAGGGPGLIVMTTHGRSGLSRAWLGSVADSLARMTACPVVLVRPGEDGAAPTAGVSRILVALDGSDRSAAVLPMVRRLAHAAGARVTLFRVVDSDDGIPAAESELAEVAARADLAGADSAVVAAGAPAPAILDRARADGADLIAVTTRGRGEVARMFLGSVVDKVLRGADVPVLVHGAMEEER